ncbi:Cell division cycle-associated 7-like protein [Linum perenne]
MVSTRRPRVGIAADEEADGVSQSPDTIPASGEYENLREQRIKENKERLEKLGLLDLALKLKASKKNPKIGPSAAKSRKTPPDSESSRRSTRLQYALISVSLFIFLVCLVIVYDLLCGFLHFRLKTLAPVSYTEIVTKKKKEPRKDVEIHLQEGTQPEVYTDEHEKLLGSCETEWVLCVDGYGKNGKRLLDPVEGQTCHQCRQKALGLHTRCCKCELVQGQLCGDCLYMRYGENVIEVNQNPDWICPVCRGICNCSLCRKGKGWLPTGNLYRKVTKLGFNSVAHFLIQTCRAKSTPEDSSAPAEDLVPKLFDASEQEHQLGVSDVQLADSDIGTEERDESDGDHE